MKNFIYFDLEFTELKKNAELITIALVTGGGDSLYLESSEYDKLACNDWIKKNVLKNIDTPDAICTKAEIKTKIVKFLKSYQAQITDIARDPYPLLRMCGDAVIYDYVLFLDLFDGTQDLPDFMFFIPFDLASVFFKAGINPDIDRTRFSGLQGKKAHCALDDAMVIKACYERVLS